MNGANCWWNYWIFSTRGSLSLYYCVKGMKIVLFYHLCKTLRNIRPHSITRIHSICVIHLGCMLAKNVNSMFLFRLSIFHDLRMGINISSKNVMLFVCHSMCITVTFNNFNLLCIFFFWIFSPLTINLLKIEKVYWGWLTWSIASTT